MDESIFERLGTVTEERDIARADLEKVVGYNTKLQEERDDAFDQMKRSKTRADGHYENYCQILKRIDVVVKERDEARADVERLKRELYDTIESYKLNNLQPKTTRPEPSRLEIAAQLMASNLSRDTNKWDTQIEVIFAIEQADALIAAAKEGK